MSQSRSSLIFIKMILPEYPTVEQIIMKILIDFILYIAYVKKEILN